jgi:hypothetical protein
MIMQRPDSDDDSFFLTDSPVDGVQVRWTQPLFPGCSTEAYLRIKAAG